MEFGKFGGQFVPPVVIDALNELEKTFNEAIKDPRLVKDAPHDIPLPGSGVGRLDETQAARKPDLIWNKE